MLTQLRVFNTSRKVWVIAFITNDGGEIPGRMFGTFTATEKAGEVIMEPPPTEYCQLKTNFIFDITDNSFEWRSESSADSGKTWEVNISLSATRVK